MQKEPRTYFVDAAATSLVHGGSKAKADIAALLKRSGATSLPLGGKGRIGQIGAVARLVLVAFLYRRASVFMNFPSYNASARFAMCLMGLRQRLVLIIHDIDLVRAVSPTQSLAVLKFASACVITGRLDELPEVAGKLPKEIFRLPAWDYLIAPSLRRSELPSGDAVLFAGNLDPTKSPWIYKQRNLPLLLAGTNFNLVAASPEDKYIGTFLPDAPKFPEEAGWGLVWDGDSVDRLSGPTGIYQTHNQPHKFSMYIAVGLPIICNRHAAIADLVHRWNIGFSVDSVNDISTAISEISDETKMQMRQNITAIAAKMWNGDFLTSAIKRFCE